MSLSKWFASLLVVLAAGVLAAEDRADLVVADFEGENYGDWKATGEAFGPGPAKGTLPNQMPVVGFLGKGLVNSYFKGDDSIGTLTSPPLKIERRFLNFLIGGGQYPGEACIQLKVEGKIVRSATGPNDRPGGSEQLDWQSWDLADLAGKMGTIEIIDQRKGGWGHINIDHIVQSDRRKSASQELQREIVVEKKYLLLPVRTGATKRRVKFSVDGAEARDFEIELDAESPQFWTFANVAQFQGKKLTIRCVLPAESSALGAILASDEPIRGEKLYQERQRPQFHFTSRRGWLNDPNGLVYHNGQWHLFYQHNPFGWSWGNMHWGHAVSRDLFHWQETDIAIYPRQWGDWAFSGSAVVDQGNTSGWGTKQSPPLVAAYTSTGRGECIVYSNDEGKTWKEFEGNPVVKHAGRDPKLLWHEPTKRWVMALYDEHQGKQWITFHTSADLKKWEFASRIEGYFECPDLFELKTADGKTSRWVLYAADGRYTLGSFDGREFKPEGPKQQVWHGRFYAAQSYDNAPDGRRVQVGWGNGVSFPGASFNQQMTVPVELTLRKHGEALRMHAEPVKELGNLRGDPQIWGDVLLGAADSKNPFDSQLQKDHDLWEIVTDLRVKDAKRFIYKLRGLALVVDIEKKQIRCRDVTAPLEIVDGKLRVQILVDRGSVEVFAQDGAAAMSVGFEPGTSQVYSLTAEGGEARADLKVTPLKSAWE